MTIYVASMMTHDGNSHLRALYSYCLLASDWSRNVSREQATTFIFMEHYSSNVMCCDNWSVCLCGNVRGVNYFDLDVLGFVEFKILFLFCGKPETDKISHQ